MSSTSGRNANYFKENCGQNVLIFMSLIFSNVDLKFKFTKSLNPKLLKAR